MHRRQPPDVCCSQNRLTDDIASFTMGLWTSKQFVKKWKPCTAWRNRCASTSVRWSIDSMRSHRSWSASSQRRRTERPTPRNRGTRRGSAPGWNSTNPQRRGRCHGTPQSCHQFGHSRPIHTDGLHENWASGLRRARRARQQVRQRRCPGRSERELVAYSSQRTNIHSVCVQSNPATVGPQRHRRKLEGNKAW